MPNFLNIIEFLSVRTRISTIYPIISLKNAWTQKKEKFPKNTFKIKK